MKRNLGLQVFTRIWNTAESSVPPAADFDAAQPGVSPVLGCILRGPQMPKEEEEAGRRNLLL